MIPQIDVIELGHNFRLQIPLHMGQAQVSLKYTQTTCKDLYPHLGNFFTLSLQFSTYGGALQLQIPLAT